MENQIRWKQRFRNFEKAYRLIEEISAHKTLNKIEQLALIQSFEICFELSWKLLKDYFYEGGLQLVSPREIIKQAIADEIIENGHAWLDALKSRNLTSHVYDEELAEEITDDIQGEYVKIFTDLYCYFSEKIKNENTTNR
jgi:nucleotidyltransferase substrate binding protein (TIGR01987 family)